MPSLQRWCLSFPTAHHCGYFILFYPFASPSLFLTVSIPPKLCFPLSCVSVPALPLDSQLMTCPSSPLLISFSSSGTTVGYVILKCNGLLLLFEGAFTLNDANSDPFFPRERKRLRCKSSRPGSTSCRKLSGGCVITLPLCTSNQCSWMGFWKAYHLGSKALKRLQMNPSGAVVA